MNVHVIIYFLLLLVSLKNYELCLWLFLHTSFISLAVETRYEKTCLRGLWPLRVCDQGWLKPTCTATKASLSLEISNIETRDIILSRQRTTKLLIRLRVCAVWSAPLLFAYDRRHVFSWSGSFKKIKDIKSVTSLNPGNQNSTYRETRTKCAKLYRRAENKSIFSIFNVYHKKIIFQKGVS